MHEQGPTTRWREAAACRGVAVEVFFPPERMDRYGRAEQPEAAAVARATAVCRSCPVVAPCLAWAMATNQPDGVFGGLSAVQRRRLRRGTGFCAGCGVAVSDRAQRCGPCNAAYRWAS